MLVTVRRPGARMAPISSTWACRQLRCLNSGAKHRITAAKRAGRRSMAAVLGRGRPQPNRSPAPPPQSREMAKDTMQAGEDWATLGSLRFDRELADASHGAYRSSADGYCGVRGDG